MNLAAVVLAAGVGSRLRPLTDLRPKALCPVGNVPLVDVAIARVGRHAGDVAVNVHHHRDQMVAHLRDRVHLSIEPSLLGTAGALAELRDWIGGRAVLVVNADAWHDDDLTALIDAWDGTRPRLLVVRDPARADFDGGLRYTGACLLPPPVVARLPRAFSGLYDQVFAREPLEFRVSGSPFFDCGTLRDYHAANMAASGGVTVVGEGARVLGTAQRCVLWPGVTVGPDEHLVEVIRPADGITLRV